MPSALARIFAYLAILFLPLIVMAVFHPPNQDTFLYNLGRSCGLLGFAILIAQVVLAARLKWVEKPFGLNITSPFHRRLGVFAALLLLVHPMLLALGGSGWPLLLGFKVDWFIWPARAALLLLLIHVGISVWRTEVGLKFEEWRLWHDFLAPAILVLVFVHSWYAGEDLTVVPMQALWVLLLALAVGLFGYHRLLRPRLLARHPYRVTEVRQEAPQVWTLKFAPPPGLPRFDFLPGQFQFVTLLRGAGLPVEEHHFTISSSPTDTGFHTSTIKAVGDFTATIGDTRVGDLAVVQAPFGRFSYLVHPEARDLVFIAGGIGITPLMSNLRHMRATGAERRVLLLYSNKSEADIVFRQELDGMAGEEKPDLQVVHILTRPEAGWQGETGRLDQGKLERLCGPRLARSTFFLCCPPPMMRSLVGVLGGLGVPVARISYEYFSL